VDQREDLQIQEENTGKENRMLNWVRAGYGLTRMILRSLSALSLNCSDQREMYLDITIPWCNSKNN
jgi:hypothetical protein